MIDTWVQIDINKKLKRDLKYIEDDIIAKQFKIDKNASEDEKEKFIKFCKPLNAIGIIDMTKKQYKKYWSTQYINFPEEKEIVLNAVEKKFKDGLISPNEMIQLIENSKDYETEKKRAIKLLKGKK